MKVITQLVQHFWQRGALTTAEVDYLVRHGFVRERDLPGYVPPPPEALEDRPTFHPVEPLPQTPLERVEETLVRRKSRRGRGGEPKRPVLEIDELCERLQADFDRRGPHLDSLTKLAKRIAPCDDWRAALAVFRQTDAGTFQKSLAAALRTGALTLRDLWPALDIEPLHRVIADDEVRGRTARAYLALLVSSDVAQLGKYAWILQSDEVQVANNLRVAHGMLLAGLAQFYLRDRRLLARSFAHGADPIAVWALVLLHNACRKALKTAPDDYGPLEEPEIDVWQRAWTAALTMDHPRVTLLLVNCYHDSAARSRLRPRQSGHHLFCPKGWHVPHQGAAALPGVSS
ncbi:MAG: hypothetical protein ACT4QC_15655 [Planctomycetaceae bacterium]